MRTSKLSLVAAGALLGLGAMSSANALTLTAGNYKITLDNYDKGTLYANPTTSTVICSSIAACDSAALLNPTPAGTATNLSADTTGIFSVALIQNITNGQVEYTKGVAGNIGGVAIGPYLTGVFGNLVDKYVEVACGILTGCSTTALAVTAPTGASNFKIFSNAADWSPNLGPANGDLNALTYGGISGGALFLEGVFAAGAVFAGDATASYVTTYNSSTINGSGQGYLDFTGGAALSFFDTNTITNVNGGKNDAYLTTTFDDVNGAASGIGWTVKSVSQISGATLPEPGSLALVSLALLGAGLSARRVSKGVKA